MNALVWFGVLGGPLAWAAQLVLGYQLGLARCESPNLRFPVAFHPWSLALALAAVMVAALGEAVAITIFRATREAEELTPKRIHFLATVAMTVNPLVLTIAAMTAVGTSILPICHQS